MKILYTLLRNEGLMILSDFHPFRKCVVKKENHFELELNYFNEEIHAGELAYKQYFDEKEQKDFPDVSIRLYTLSEILNAVIFAGFRLQKMEEHQGWNGENIPWEFTVVAIK